jgi:hypothetical protein
VDPQIIAAIIAAGAAVVVAILGGIGWLVKRRLNKKDVADQSADLAAGERRQAIDSLISAGLEGLSSLDDTGDMRAAELVAHEQLSTALDRAQRLGDADVSGLGRKLATAAKQGDREAVEAALADLEDARGHS